MKREQVLLQTMSDLQINHFAKLVNREVVRRANTETGPSVAKTGRGQGRRRAASESGQFKKTG